MVGRGIGGLGAAAAMILAAPVAAQDAGAGATIFKQRCALCHVVKAGVRTGMGPNLAGLAGRRAASTDFAYSPALKASQLKWDKPTLDRFLTAPAKLVPGTRMVFAVPDPKQRANLIAYLITLK